MKYFTYIRAHWIFVITHEYNFYFSSRKSIIPSMLFKKAGRYTNISERLASKIIYKF